MRVLLFILLLGILLFSPGVAAAQNPTPTPTPKKGQVVKNQVEKTYCSLAVGAETVQALKDDLLLKAKHMAVNELFGEMITAVTETENFVVTRDQVRALSTGYVRIRSSRYFNGENFAEACVTIKAYVTEEDRAQFRPVQLEKRYCGTDPNMTVAQIRAHTQEEALIQALLEYDPQLADVERDTLLRLMRRVKYPESGFVPGTESYCVTVKGEVLPVEVFALLEGRETGASSSPSTPGPNSSARKTPTPQPTEAKSGAAVAQKPTATPRPRRKAPRIIVRNADAQRSISLVDANLPQGALPAPRVIVAYADSMIHRQLTVPPQPAQSWPETQVSRIQVQYADSVERLGLAFPFEISQAGSSASSAKPRLAYAAANRSIRLQPPEGMPIPINK